MSLRSRLDFFWKEISKARLEDIWFVDALHLEANLGRGG